VVLPHRSPVYEQLRSTIAKATETGLVLVSVNTYKLADDWFAAIHEADSASDNDYDALLSFLRKLGDRELAFVSAAYSVPRDAYDRAVRSVTRMFR
jgi:hypothetical protein